MATILTPDWDATHLAVHREDLIGHSRQSELSLLRHPSYPFLAEISADPPALFAELRWVARNTLRTVAPLDAALKEALELLEAWGAQRVRMAADHMGRAERPDRSARLLRGAAVPGRPRVGSNRCIDGGKPLVKGDVIERVEGLAVGLRVVMHADPPTHGKPVPIRVTGLSMCELRRAVEPDAIEPKSIQLVLRSACAVRPGKPGFHRNGEIERSRAGDPEFAAGHGRRGTTRSVRQDLARVPVGHRCGSTRCKRRSRYSLGTGAGAAHLCAAAVSRRTPKLFFRDPASCGSAGDIQSSDRRHATRMRQLSGDAPFLPEAGRARSLPGSSECHRGSENRARAVQSIDPPIFPCAATICLPRRHSCGRGSFSLGCRDFDLSGTTPISNSRSCLC